MHYKLIDFNSNGVMLCSPCGGAAGELNTCCGFPPMITADQWGGPSSGTTCYQAIVEQIIIDSLKATAPLTNFFVGH